MTYQVKEGQNILDITLEVFGSVEYLYEILVINNLSVTDTLTPLSFITLPNIEGVGNEANKRTIKAKKYTFANNLY